MCVLYPCLTVTNITVINESQSKNTNLEKEKVSFKMLFKLLNHCHILKSLSQSGTQETFKNGGHAFRGTLTSKNSTM